MPTDKTTGVRIAEVVHHFNQRVDNFLMRECRGVPRSRIYRMIRRGELRVNGRRVRPSYRLEKGDNVRIPPAQLKKSASMKPSAHLLAQVENAICVREDGFIVMNKPAGIAVHGGSGVPVGVIDALNATNSGVSHQLVHRLDRDTSGCLIVATSLSIARQLCDWLRKRDVEKSYEALVGGRWPVNLTRIDLRLRRHSTKSGERKVYPSDSGDPAVTIVEPLRFSENISWVRFRPETGRTHQLRVHANASGHPIVGDRKYGGDCALPRAPRMMLHATSIELPDGRRFEAPVDPAFQEYWDSVSDTSEQA